MVRDISARKQVEKQMQEAAEQYRRLTELSPDGIAVHQDGRVVLVNPAGARTLGYSEPAELVGRPVLELVHPDDRLRVIERISRTLKEGRPGEMNEERFVRKDGSFVPVEVVNAPFYWRGRPAVLVVVRDITERKRAEEQLVESEQRYRQLVEASPDGVAVYQDGVIVMANRACAVMLGYGDSLELLGRRAATVVHPDDMPVVQEAESKMGDTATPQQPLLVRFVRRDGSILGAAVSGVTTTWQGRPAVQVTVRPDNTDRSRPTVRTDLT
jgi:PAS domain S-box-containing protein